MRTNILLIALGSALGACTGEPEPGDEDLAAGAVAQPEACMDIQPPELSPDRSHLLNPDDAVFEVTAPDTFRVNFETTAGPFVVEVIREWAPLGADRFYSLVTNGFYDDVAFFRVLPGFVVQWGLHGVPAVNDAWRGARIPDDPVRTSNTPGTITYAMAGPGTRTTQLFVNFGNNAGLDAQGFAPFGRVVEGMDAVQTIHSYGEPVQMGGSGPDLACVQQSGNNYLRQEFDELDFIERATVATQ